MSVPACMRVSINDIPPEITIEQIHLSKSTILSRTSELSSFKGLFESFVEHEVDNSNVDDIYMMGNSKTSNRN